MELNAVLAAQSASRLVELEQEIRDLKAEAADWKGKAAAAGAGSTAEERYLEAYSAVNAQLLELQKQKGLLLQCEAGEWWLGRRGLSVHPYLPLKVLLVCLDCYASREEGRNEGFGGCLGGQGL